MGMAEFRHARDYTGSMTQRVETPQRLARPLIRLARATGIATSYIGQTDDYHEINDDVIVAVLGALGVDASDDESASRSLHDVLDTRRRRLVAPTVLHTVGVRDRVRINTAILEAPSASVTLEDGSAYEGALLVEPAEHPEVRAIDGTFIANADVVLPADLPMGYHTLHVQVGERSQDAVLVSAPDTVEEPEGMKDRQLWGWMAQLYSIRSASSWGVGDFEDLKTLLIGAKHRTGADFVLINPVHASEPVSPLIPSPYLPVSRRFVNFTYIRPESIDEYGTLDDASRAQVDELHDQAEPLNGDAQLIDRDAMWRVKMRALWLIFKAGRDDARQAVFERFKQDAGADLDAYASWCLCYDKWGAPTDDANGWQNALGADSEATASLRAQFPDTFDFYRWLEWVATDQLRSAQQAARRAGMVLGVMSDMAVGVHPRGADVWGHPDGYVHGVTVGAPPDYFNQQGQDWSQPPMNPVELANSGYRIYRDMVHGMFSQAGAVRIDHILGLFRLWWIPQGKAPTEGTYVHYDAGLMLGILCIEARRAHGIVVGEDLGVVPESVEEALEQHRILGCAVEWFEQRDGVFLDPHTWRTNALASVNTHDLPPAAGYLAYEQVKIREQLQLLTMPAEEFRASAVREHNAMLQMLIERGFLEPSMVEDESAHIQQIVEALYRVLKAAPSRLLAASIVDAVGETRAQNQPGTNNEYPNWRIPLADADGKVVPLEQLYDNARLKSLAAIMNAPKR